MFVVFPQAVEAKRLDCDKDSISGLVDIGLLQGEQTRHGLRITEESIAECKQSYLPLVSLAKALETKSFHVGGRTVRK